MMSTKEFLATHWLANQYDTHIQHLEVILA
jgi:hypothetical protein